MMMHAVLTLMTVIVTDAAMMSIVLLCLFSSKTGFFFLNFSTTFHFKCIKSTITVGHKNQQQPDLHIYI